MKRYYIGFLFLLTLVSVRSLAQYDCSRTPSINAIGSGCGSVSGLASYYGIYDSETNVTHPGPFYFEWFKQSGSGFISIYAEYGTEDGEGGVGSYFTGVVDNNDVFYVRVSDPACGWQQSQQLTVHSGGLGIGGVATSCSPGVATVKLSGGPSGTNYTLYKNGVSQESNSTGSFSITYTESDVFEGRAFYNGCSATTQVAIVNEELSAVQITGNILCAPGAFTLTAQNYQAGYFTWYANGNIIPNQHSYRLTGTAVAGVNYSCSVRITETGTCTSPISSVTIVIESLPTVDAGSDQSVCLQAGQFELTGGTPANAVWSGTGVSGTRFNTAVSGVGTFPLTYTYTSARGCTRSDTRVITVKPHPPATISRGVTGFDGSALLTANAGTNYSYSWKRNGVGIPGVSGRTYLPSQSGQYIVVVSAQGCSTNSASTSVLVNDENYIVTNTLQVPGFTSFGQVNDLAAEDYTLQQSITYFDGVGRTKQVVSRKRSPESQDIVLPKVYDDFNREETRYLPYTSTETDGWIKEDALDDGGGYPTSPQADFYNQTGSTIAVSSQPYATHIYEPSPLNRVTRQGAPGEAWQPNANGGADHTVHTSYHTNAASEIMRFGYDAVSAQLTYVPGAYYGAGMLSAKQTTDEHGNTSWVYEDGFGKTIVRRVEYKKENGAPRYADTYYVYDTADNLAIVLPPEAVESIKTSMGQ